MGVKQFEDLPIVTFTRTVEHKVIVNVKNTEQLNYADKLKRGAVNLGRGEDFRQQAGIIEVNGLKACIYIKDQRAVDYYDSYRFHLCWCKTIEQMVNEGRKNRYLATVRDDGFFRVNHQINGRNMEKLKKLDLCKYCKKMLEARNMYFSPFTLSDFFRKYQTDIAESFQREETHISKEQYAPDHREVAARYKAEVQYKCQKCGTDYSQNKELLELHHKDGNGQNNQHYNLVVLCIDCHSKEPRHSRVKNSPQFREKINKLNILRQTQDYTVLSPF